MLTSMSMWTNSNHLLLEILVSLWTVRCQRDPIYLMLLYCASVPDPFHMKIATFRCNGDARTSLVHSQLDYCKVVFTSLPACEIRRLQSVLNSSVRLITGAQKYDHVALTSSVIEGEACDLRTLSLWKCRKLGYRLVTELSLSQARTPRTVFP